MCTLIVLTRLAVLFATSLADCTKCLLATGFAVFDEAMRQALHRADVCLATIVAADKTCKNQHRTGTVSRGGRVTTLSKARQQSQTKTPLAGHKQSKVPCPDRDGLPAILSNHLRWAARWINQVLASHLDRLVGTGKLDGVNEALLTSLAVWIWDTDQVSSLETGKRRKQSQ